VVNASGGA